VWYLPDGIANIISMHELEETYRITYDSWARYYVVHTPKGEVRFYKDEQGLPYLDLEESSEAAVLLLQLALVQTVRGNYEGYTKGKVSEGSAQGAGDDGEPKREGLQDNGEQ